jgi:hypothetical protein
MEMELWARVASKPLMLKDKKDSQAEAHKNAREASEAAEKAIDQ